MASPLAPVCVPMPSATAARDFFLGTPGSLVHLILSYAGRTAIVAGGMYAAGKRDHVLRDAAAGTAIIEAAVLAYFAVRPRPAADIPSQQHLSRFLQGHPEYILPILEDVTARALEIAGGMYLAGTRKGIVKGAIGGSLAVQLFITAYAVYFGKPCPQP
jgi:hypothetical protein